MNRAVILISKKLEKPKVNLIRLKIKLVESMSRIKQLFALTLIFISTSGSSITSKQTTECCEEYCYEEDTYRPQYKNLGTITPYAFVKGNDTQIYSIPGEW